MKIVSWNVNSIKSRLEHFLKWQAEFQPDVILLQELKGVEENFPFLEMEQAGYQCAVYGQKAYNGVAIISKHPIDDVTKHLPDFDDEAARYIEGTVKGIRVASVYVPNGQKVGSEKYAYKMQFYDSLYDHMKQSLNNEQPFVVGGDFNVAFNDNDVAEPDRVRNRILFSAEERRVLKKLTNLGYADSYRIFDPNSKAFSWWDYREGSFQRDKGFRIDHILTSPHATDLLSAAGIDRTPRGWEKPSDHTPVWAEFEGV